MEEINSGLPRVTVKEKDDEVIVKIYISGVNKDDIELEIKEDFLKVDINKSSEEKKKDDDYFIEEWGNFSFSGRVSLPCKVIPMLIHYEYDGRVLEIQFKKTPKGIIYF